jgi:hypothetical protein
MERSKTGLSLQTVMAASLWSTPRASDGEKGGPNMSFGAGGQPLPAQMHQASAYWRSPTVRDVKATLNADTQNQVMLARQMADMERLGGQGRSASSATTRKRGAPNPAFPCWLMGFPDAWLSGALQAMQSYQSSRPKSSKRTSKPNDLGR